MLGERQGWSSETVLVARDAAQAVLSSPGDPFGLRTQIPEPGPLPWVCVGAEVMTTPGSPVTAQWLRRDPARQRRRLARCVVPFPPWLEPGRGTG